MHISLYNTKSFLQIDDKIVCEFENTLTDEKIRNTIQQIESFLQNILAQKIDDILVIMIELLQNALKYSYESVISNNKYDSRGTFTITINSASKTCIIKCSNLIVSSKKATILERFQEVQGLDQNALRKLSKEKMRSKKYVHSVGAGLGFITIALRVDEPIAIEFIPHKEDILEYIVTLHI